MTQFVSDKIPINTVSAFRWIKAVSHPMMMWDNLPINHPDKLSCSTRNFSFFNRPVDDRNRTDSQQKLFEKQLENFLNPEGEERCLVSMGFYQLKNIQSSGVINSMWRPLRDLIETLSRQLHPDDIYMHLRCENGIYGIPSKIY